MSNKATIISQKVRSKADTFFADFSEANNKAAYYDALGNQNYYRRNRPFYLLCVFLAVAAQGAAAFSSYAFINAWVSIKVTNVDFALMLTVALLLTIEVAKYFSVHSVFESKFSLAKPPINYVGLIIAVIVSVFSMFASVKGGGSLGIDEKKVVSAKSDFDTHISQVREEIADIKKRNTWKGNTYIAGKDKALLLSKEAALAGLREKKDISLGKIEAENAQSESAFQYAFLTIEVLFFLFTFFQFNYKYNCAIEFEREKEENATQEVTNPVTTLVSNLGMTQPVSGNGTPQQKKIGFSFGGVQAPTSIVTSVVNEVALKDGNRNCLHCGSVYEYKIINQKYCSEKCRVEAWQNKTGKTLASKKGGKHGK